MGIVTDQYLNASQAFFRSRQTSKKMANQIRRYGMPLGQSMPAPDTVWTLPAPPISGGASPRGDWIQTDPTMGDYVLRLIESAAPVVADTFDQGMGALAFSAWRQWPVSSGYSRSSLALAFTAEGDQFVGRVVVGADYWRYIKGHPHRRLLERPARDTVVEMGEAILTRLQEGPQP